MRIRPQPPLPSVLWVYEDVSWLIGRALAGDRTCGHREVGKGGVWQPSQSNRDARGFGIVRAHHGTGWLEHHGTGWRAWIKMGAFQVGGSRLGSNPVPQSGPVGRPGGHVGRAWGVVHHGLGQSINEMT
jgi:hypothetical protein